MNITSQNIGVYGGFDTFSNAQSGINASLQSNSSVSQGTLETSNVDLTQSAVNQITAQNGVMANVQSIQTADSIWQTLLDIKA